LRSLKDNDQRRPIVSIVLAQLAAVPFVLAGITLVLGSLGGLYWLVPGLIFSITIGVATAWTLLVEI